MLKRLNAQDLISRSLANNQDPEYWKSIYEDLREFLDGNYPEEDKKLVRKRAWIESVYMMYSGFYLNEDRSENKEN